VANSIERPEVTRARLGVGLSKFRDFVDYGNGDAVIAGTDIRRLKPVPLGARAIGFLSDEVDSLVEALRAHRDSVPQHARVQPEHLRTGRDAYWKRQRRKRAKQERSKGKRRETAIRGKARKVAKTAKRVVAKVKPKRAPVKKAARKVKPPVAAVVETVAAEVIEQPTPGVITVTEVEETEARKAS